MLTQCVYSLARMVGLILFYRTYNTGIDTHRHLRYGVRKPCVLAFQRRSDRTKILKWPLDIVADVRVKITKRIYLNNGSFTCNANSTPITVAHRYVQIRVIRDMKAKTQGFLTPYRSYQNSKMAVISG